MTKVAKVTKVAKRNRYKRWNKREDALLIKLQKNRFSWESISSKIDNTTPQKCKYRWLNHLNTGNGYKGRHRLQCTNISNIKERHKSYDRWTKVEDTLLIQLRDNGFSWSDVSKRMNRNSKQCRERWTNHLDPYIIKGNWSKLEDSIIVCYRRIYGNKWTKISKMVPQRSCDAIKHRWYALAKRKDANPEIIEPTSFNTFNSQITPNPIDFDILDIFD